jgi:hypothetical protein
MPKLWSLLLLAAMVAGATGAAAEPTDIVVRVLGKNSKFIGTSMGGVRITLRDAQTGELLATGVTAGGTGDTRRIMDPQGGRWAPRADDTTAKFAVTLDLDEPRLIEAEAYGPLAQPQAAHRAVSTQWVVPGRPIAGGDGWVLVLQGFVVDVLAPAAHARLPAGTREVELQANVTMMCGCPIEPGGPWDAERYEVKALIKRDGAELGGFDLAYAGETSRFAGRLPLDRPGVYEALVYAYDPDSGNTGLDRTTFILAE